MKCLNTNETNESFLQKSIPQILGLGTKLCLATIESIFQKYVSFSFLYFIRVSFALHFLSLKSS